MALGKKEEDFRNMLNEQAKRILGNERAKELAQTIQQLASSLAAVSNYEVPLEMEPAFFKSE